MKKEMKQFIFLLLIFASLNSFCQTTFKVAKFKEPRNVLVISSDSITRKYRAIKIFKDSAQIDTAYNFVTWKFNCCKRISITNDSLFKPIFNKSNFFWANEGTQLHLPHDTLPFIDPCIDCQWLHYGTAWEDWIDLKRVILTNNNKENVYNLEPTPKSEKSKKKNKKPKYHRHHNKKTIKKKVKNFPQKQIIKVINKLFKEIG